MINISLTLTFTIKLRRNDWPGMVLTSRMLNIDMKTLEPCNHTKADTRTCIFLHLVHAEYQGHTKVFAPAVDCDIVVLAQSLFENVMLAELWIGFVSGKSYRDIPVHIPHKSLALPLFHSLAGCNTAHFLHFELWQEEWLKCMGKYS